MDNETYLAGMQGASRLPPHGGEALPDFIVLVAGEHHVLLILRRCQPQCGQVRCARSNSSQDPIL